MELEQSFIEKFHAYLHHDLGMFSNDLSGFNCLKYMVNTAFNNGWIPRNPLVLYRFTFPQCAESLRCPGDEAVSLLPMGFSTDRS